MLNVDPLAEPDSIRVHQGNRIIFRLTDNDFNSENSALTITAVTQPASLGSVTIEEYGFRLDYQAPLDAAGTDPITYTVENSAGGTDTAVVDIEVLPGVSCIDDTWTVEPGESVLLDVLANDRSLEGDTPDVATISALNVLVGTWTVPNVEGREIVRYTAQVDFDGTEVFVYENRVTKDGYNLICAATVTVTVLDRLPVVTAPLNQASAEGAWKNVGLGSFSDPDGDGVGLWAVGVDWGDGSADTTFTAAMMGSLGLQFHKYGADGAYPVTVTVTNGDGDSGEATFDVTVANVAPDLRIGPGQTGASGVARWLSLGYFIDPGTDDSLWSVTVDWGDGSAADSFAALVAGPWMYRQHTYAAGGRYQVSVTVADGDGDATTRSFAVAITGMPPVICGTGNLSGVAGQGRWWQLGYFTDPGSTAPWTVSVDWGDGTAADSYETTGVGQWQYRQHIYAVIGDYTSTITVTDSGGAASSKTFAVTALNVAAVIHGTANRTSVAGPLRWFQLGYFTDPGSTAPWTVTVSWGDGTAVESYATAGVGVWQQRQHAYATPGVFTVTMTVTDADGATSTKTFTVTVS